MNLVLVSMVGLGILLLYAAIKGYNPMLVVKNVLTGKAPADGQ